jgi:glutathione S-transferase
MKLYSSVLAPSPRRAVIAAREKSIDLEIIEVDIAKGETKHADFLKINPLGEIPVLVREDGSTLTESVAICRYFEEIQPTPSLFGQTTEQRVRIQEALDQATTRLYLPVTQIFLHSHPFNENRLEQIPAQAKRARELTLQEYARLDTYLGHHAYLGSEAFSMADIMAFSAIDFAKVVHCRIDPTLTHLADWYNRVKHRPSTQR